MAAASASSSLPDRSPEAGTPETSKPKATFFGFALIVLGLALEGLALAGWGAEWGSGKWPDVLVSVGAGALLAGFVMFLEPRLVRDVKRATRTSAAEAAAREVTNRTREIDERLTRLEGTRDIQDRVHQRRSREASRLAERLRAAPDYSDVDAVLADGEARGMFGPLWLKCGPNRGLLVQFNRVETWRGDGQYLGWQIHATVGRTTPRPPLPPGVQENLDSYVDTVARTEWLPDEPLEAFLERFDQTRARVSLSRADVDLATAFDSLADSHELMENQRNSEAGTSIRLSGPLMLRVNDQWAITYGGQGAYILEGLLGEMTFTQWPPAASDGASGDIRPVGYDAPQWEEARFYARGLLPHRIQ